MLSKIWRINLLRRRSVAISSYFKCLKRGSVTSRKVRTIKLGSKWLSSKVGIIKLEEMWLSGNVKISELFETWLRSKVWKVNSLRCSGDWRICCLRSGSVEKTGKSVVV